MAGLADKGWLEEVDANEVGEGAPAGDVIWGIGPGLQRDAVQRLWQQPVRHDGRHGAWVAPCRRRARGAGPVDLDVRAIGPRLWVKHDRVREVVRVHVLRQPLSAAAGVGALQRHQRRPDIVVAMREIIPNRRS